MSIERNIEGRDIQLSVFKAFVEDMISMGVITDDQSRILYVNTAFKEETGYEDVEVIGKSANTLKSGYHSIVFYNNLYQTLAAGLKWEGRFKNRRKDGSTYWEEATIFPVAMDGQKYYCKTAVNTTGYEELSSEKEASILLASTIQQSLISQDRYDEKLVVKGKYMPLEHVSGDIYNHYRIDDDRYGVFVADEVGHGVASALMTTSILAVVNELIHYEPMPDRFLQKLNNKIMTLFKSAELTQTLYFTAVYLLIDTKEGLIHYANCGHPKIYRIGQEGVTSFSKINFCLGMFQNAQFDYDTLKVSKGDRIFAYTDGIIELEGDMAKGETVLLEALKAYGLSPNGSLVDVVYDRCIRQLGSSMNDDISLVEMVIQ